MCIIIDVNIIERIYAICSGNADQHGRRKQQLCFVVTIFKCWKI